MVGVIFSILAGMAMSIQGVFNTRLSEKIAPAWPQLVGALMMVGGIILYKWKVR